MVRWRLCYAYIIVRENPVDAARGISGHVHFELLMCDTSRCVFTPRQGDEGSYDPTFRSHFLFCTMALTPEELFYLSNTWCPPLFPEFRETSYLGAAQKNPRKFLWIYKKVCEGKGLLENKFHKQNTQHAESMLKTLKHLTQVFQERKATDGQGKTIQQWTVLPPWYKTLQPVSEEKKET